MKKISRIKTQRGLTADRVLRRKLSKLADMSGEISNRNTDGKERKEEREGDSERGKKKG